MTQVFSPNNIGSDTEFIPSGRSFIYIMNNRRPSINPWETPHSTAREKILSLSK